MLTFVSPLSLVGETAFSRRLQLRYLDPNRRCRRVHPVQHHFWYVSTLPACSTAATAKIITDTLTPVTSAFAPTPDVASVIYYPDAHFDASQQSQGFNSTSTRSHVADEASTTGSTRRLKRRPPRRRPRRPLLPPSKSPATSQHSIQHTYLLMFISSDYDSKYHTTLAFSFSRHDILVGSRRCQA